MTLKDPLTDPTRLHNPVPRTSTQSTDTEDCSPNPQKLAAKVGTSSQANKSANFIPPTTESAAKQKGSAGLDTSAGGSHQPADHSSSRKRRCKIVHMTKKSTLHFFHSFEMLGTHNLSTQSYVYRHKFLFSRQLIILHVETSS